MNWQALAAVLLNSITLPVLSLTMSRTSEKGKTACAALASALLCYGAICVAQDRGMELDEPTSGKQPEEGVQFRRLGPAWHYGDKGLEYDPANSDTSLRIGLRFQTRFDTYPGDLKAAEDLNQASNDDIDLRRGRIKGSSALFADWLQIYSEYDFAGTTLLD